MEKSIHFTSFPTEIFSIFFLHSISSIEISIHELENIKSFSSLEYGTESSKSNKSASAFLKSCFVTYEKC